MRRLRFYWQPLFISLVYLLGFVTFLNSGMAGPTTPERILQALYCSLSLFFLGGLDLGWPAGPSAMNTSLLWILYFLAPLLTASYAYNFVQKKILGRIPRGIKGHTILCGLGRNGHLIYELIRETMPRDHKLVVIEQNEANPYLAAVRKDAYAWLLQSDFSRLPTLEQARIRKAQRIIFSTNLDLENINAVIDLQMNGMIRPEQSIFCHLGDLEMLDNLQHTLFKEDAYQKIHVFNGYQCATRQLYKKLQDARLVDKEGTVFILFGYGRFAHMLFVQITEDPARTPADEVIIVTQKLSSGYDLERMRFGYSRDDQSTPCLIHSPILMDMHNPAAWAQVDAIMEGKNKPVLAFLCRDNDVANMDLAISIKLKGPASLRKATYICRMYADTVQELNEMLDHRLTPHQTHDVILFPLQAELKRAFQNEIFSQ